MVRIGHLLRLEGGEGQKTSICGAEFSGRHATGGGTPPYYRPRRVEQRLQPQGGVVPTVAGGDGQQALPTVAAAAAAQSPDPVPVSGYFLPDGLFKQVRVLRSELRGVPAGRRPPAVRRRVVVLHVGGGQPGHAVWRADSCQYKGVLHAVPTAAGRDRKRGRRLAACVVPDPEPL